jgi:hypothetical protein
MVVSSTSGARESVQNRTPARDLFRNGSGKCRIVGRIDGCDARSAA